MSNSMRLTHQEIIYLQTQEEDSDTEVKEVIKMDSILHPPSSLSCEGNLKENWKNWLQRFEIYLEAAGLDKASD